jgi:hypothetical protein
MTAIGRTPVLRGAAPAARLCARSTRSSKPWRTVAKGGICAYRHRLQRLLPTGFRASRAGAGKRELHRAQPRSRKRLRGRKGLIAGRSWSLRVGTVIDGLRSAAPTAATAKERLGQTRPGCRLPLDREESPIDIATQDLGRVWYACLKVSGASRALRQGGCASERALPIRRHNRLPRSSAFDRVAPPAPVLAWSPARTISPAAPADQIPRDGRRRRL